MRKIILLFSMMFIIVACHDKNKTSGKLTAVLENIPDGTILNIYDIDSGKIISRIPVYENKFEFSFRFPKPKLIGIWEDNPKYDKYRKLLWADNTEINLTGNYDYFVNAKVIGAPSNIIYEELSSFERNFDNKIYELNHSKRISKDRNVKDSISKMIIKVTNDYRDQEIKLFLKNIDSYVVLHNLKWETVEYNSVLVRNDIQKLYDSLPQEFKLLPEGKMINEYLSLPNKPKIGDKFIDVTLSTPDGKTESLSNNLGKYTILEFWASSCGPCRMEHSKLRMVYNKYHNLGLNIIGISGDTDLNDWVSAIKQDSIPWLNISDLRGSNNKAFMIYEARAIPTLFLLNENGVILAENVQIDFLESKLKEGLIQNGL